MSMSLAVGLMLLSHAQTPQLPDETSTRVSPEGVNIAAGTPVDVELAEPLSSKTATQGQRFTIRLAAPLLDADGRVIIPSGATGEGEVIHARKAGFAGKAGEMIVAARFIRCGPIEVPLGRFKFGGTGESRSGSAGAVNSVASGASVIAPVAAVGTVIAFMIKGGQIEIGSGVRGVAKLKEDLNTTDEAVAACGAAVGSVGGMK